MAANLPLQEAFEVLGACRLLPDNLYSTMGYHFGRIDTFIAREHKDYVKARDKLARGLGAKPNGKGGLDLPAGEAREQYFTQHAALLEKVIEIPFEAVPVEDLRRAEGSPFEVEEHLRPKIAPAVQSALDPFLRYPDQAPSATPAAPGPKRAPAR
jgi:hypothetical protein